MKDKEKGSGDLGETTFLFNGMSGRSEDLNNFHFGVVGKALAFPFTETFMMQMAGDAEMGKWRDNYKAGKRSTPQVPSSWRPIVITYYPSSMGGAPIYGIGSPYGITLLTINGYGEVLTIIIRNTNKNILGIQCCSQHRMPS